MSVNHLPFCTAKFWFRLSLPLTSSSPLCMQPSSPLLLHVSLDPPTSQEGNSELPTHEVLTFVSVVFVSCVVCWRIFIPQWSFVFPKRGWVDMVSCIVLTLLHPQVGGTEHDSSNSGIGVSVWLLCAWILTCLAFFLNTNHKRVDSPIPTKH